MRTRAFLAMRTENCLPPVVCSKVYRLEYSGQCAQPHSQAWHNDRSLTSLFGSSMEVPPPGLKYNAEKISLGGTRCNSGTELSGVLTSWRKSISREADRKIEFLQPSAPKEKPLETWAHLSAATGNTTAQCAIIPDDIFKALEIWNVLHLPRDQ